MSIPPSRFKVDTFLLIIIAAAILATVLPVRGAGIPVVSWVSKIAVAILFFLYGVRLAPREALAGLKHWRLHTIILSCTYLVFPLIGLALGLLVPTVISTELYRGILWICIVPGTVQSAINFTSIAGGNLAGAIVSSSLSNILGVFFTPLLAMALMSATGLQISGGAILDIALQVLAPFLAGQLLRKWVFAFVTRHPRLKLFDQLTIALVVYMAFSAGMRDGIWQTTKLSDIVLILAIVLVLLAVMLWLTWHLAKWGHFNRADQIAIQFCGTKKSLTTGVPMAAVIFPAATIGFIVLPLMIFHQAQLMACSALASRYAAKDEAWHKVTNSRNPTNSNEPSNECND